MARTIKEDIIHERAYIQGLRDGFKLGEAEDHAAVIQRVKERVESVQGLKRLSESSSTTINER